MEREVVDLRAAVDRLREVYGTPRAEITDPFEIILLENVAYLVDDARRLETFARLRDEIGLTPRAILAHDAEEIAPVIAGGGMKPLMRAEKVLECARLAKEIGVELDKRVLRRYPGVGEPLADKILLFADKQRTLAPDSNALRVLLRLGFGTESKNYAASYKSAVKATANVFTKATDAQRAHILLRRHGQEICKRSAPRCELCPLRDVCAWYLRTLAPRRGERVP